MKYIITSKGHP